MYEYTYILKIGVIQKYIYSIKSVDLVRLFLTILENVMIFLFEGCPAFFNAHKTQFNLKFLFSFMQIYLSYPLILNIPQNTILLKRILSAAHSLCF